MIHQFRKKLTILLFVFCLLFSACCVTNRTATTVSKEIPSNVPADYRCNGISDSSWQERMDQDSMVMPDGSIVLIGGDNAIPFADVWRSSDGGATWSLVNPCAAWVSYQVAGWNMVMPDSSIIFFGYTLVNNTEVHGITWKSTDDGATWTQVVTNGEPLNHIPIRIMALPDTSIIILGSYQHTGNPDPRHAVMYYNDVWRSADYGRTWTELTADAGWSPRYGQSSLVLPDGSIVMMGGQDKDDDRNDTWRSMDNGATWTQMNASAAWSPRRESSSVVLPDGSIVLMGGHSHGSAIFNDVWRSSDNGATWTRMNASAGWLPRWGQSSVALPDGDIVLIGGYKPGLGRLKDVWRSPDKGATWELVNASA